MIGDKYQNRKYEWRPKFQFQIALNERTNSTKVNHAEALKTYLVLKKLGTYQGRSFSQSFVLREVCKNLLQNCEIISDMIYLEKCLNSFTASMEVTMIMYKRKQSSSKLEECETKLFEQLTLKYLFWKIF